MGCLITDKLYSRFKVLTPTKLIQMAHGHTLEELRDMSNKQLSYYYNETLKTGETNHIILHELKRREDAEHQQAIEDMTETMKRLTWWIFGLTAVNVVAVIASILIQIQQ